MYQPRFYRSWGRQSLIGWTVSYRETDLFIRSAQPHYDYSLSVIKQLRQCLDRYIAKDPSFYSSLTPVLVDAEAPDVIQQMADCAQLAKVGPMAAVAGIVAQHLGLALLNKVDEVMVENGGDIFLATKYDCIIGLYAGDQSPFTGKVGLKILADQTPIGICTSAGTVGPSLSFGCADAVTVLSPSTPLADAVATASANRIKRAQDIDETIAWARSIPEVMGIVIIKDARIGLWGDIEIVKTNETKPPKSSDDPR